MPLHAPPLLPLLLALPRRADAFPHPAAHPRPLPTLPRRTHQTPFAKPAPSIPATPLPTAPPRAQQGGRFRLRCSPVGGLLLLLLPFRSEPTEAGDAKGT